MPTRREFLAAGAVGAAALADPTRVVANMMRQPLDPPRRALSILILGGTSFLGPHQIAYALGRGHSVTTFTRGRTEPTVHRELFQHVEPLVGDRENDLTALEGRSWDVVIDNSGRRAEWTRDSASLLRDQAQLYLYTSSTGVYYPYLGDDISEDTPLLLEAPDGTEEDRKVEFEFGTMKANSELEAVAAFGSDRTVIVRPTYMLGPADRTDRFAYWPVRLAEGGEIFVPGNSDDPVQYADVRDVAEWMIRLLEDGRSGAFNAAGPPSKTGMTRFVHGAHAAFGSAADFVQVDDYDFLQEHRVRFALPWIMPVGENYGSARVDNSRALGAGMTFRPLSTTIRDVHDWWHSDAVAAERRERLLTNPRSLMVREAEILAAWKARG